MISKYQLRLNPLAGVRDLLFSLKIPALICPFDITFYTPLNKFDK